MAEGEIVIPTNEFQTPITREFLDSMPEWVKEQFLEFVYKVPLIKYMIGLDRPRAKDLPRDKNGRIIVDIAHPHILENMDYFRPAIKFFKENGCYTFLKPNRNPKSEFGKWITEEARRCREGYVRESDGEWISGYNYMFLNYSPIMVNILNESTGIVSRVEGFPDIWEGHYLRYHYIDQARHAGEHGLELSRRGSGKSFTLAGMMQHNLILGENTDAKERVTTILAAFLKEYLAQKDGTFSKFEPMLDFLAANTEFPRLMYTRRPSDMLWIMGMKTKNGNIVGSRNSVMGLSIKDDEGKIRGKRGLILFEEVGSFPNFKEVWNNVRDSVKEGSRVFSEMYGVGTAGDDASDFSGIATMLYHPNSFEIYSVPNVYDLEGDGSDYFSYFFPSYISRAGCMDKDGNSDVVKALREILMERWLVKQSGDAASLLSRTAQMPITPAEAILKVTSNFFPVVAIQERIKQLDQNPRSFDDVYVGQLVNVSGSIQFVPTDDVPIRDTGVPNTTRGALEIYEMPQKGVIPNHRYIMGCLTPGQPVVTDSGIKAVEDVTLNDLLLNKDGDYVTIKNLQRRYKENETVYSIKLVDVVDRVELTGNHPVYAATPKKRFHSWKTHLKTGVPAVYYDYDFNFVRADELRKGDVVKSPVPYLEERNLPHEYWDTKGRRGLTKISSPLAKWKFWWLVGLVLGDGWCDKHGGVHAVFNTKEKQYIARYKNAVYEIFGKHPCIVKDRKSCIEYAFSSIQFSEFFSRWFGRYADGKHISEWVKFIPKSLKVALITGYLDSDGCCCKNSIEFVSISKKLLCDIQDILLSIGIISCMKVLRGQQQHLIQGTLSNTKITYSLAIARAGVERIISILGGKDLKLKHFNPRETANHAIKRCWLSADGKYVYYKITDITKREYTGTVYNFECDTHTYMCNHLPVHNCDPVDNDQAESESLFSCIVFDLFTDTIVAEYTGRQPFAEDNYAIVLNLCLFYNATCLYESNKKMMFSYFAKNRALERLADCPDYLVQRGLVKYSLFGSSKKGVSVNTPINNFANELFRDWLMKSVDINEVTEDGEVKTTSVPNLGRIKNRALLKECVIYGPGKNTDRISAMAQVMLYREQFIIQYGGAKIGSNVNVKRVSEDEFFNNDWARYKNRMTNRPDLASLLDR